MRTLRILALGIAGVICLIAILFAALQTPPVQRLAASLISKAASGPDSGLDIGGLSGISPTELSLERMSYRDSQGPWVTAENIHVGWSLAPLLGGRLRIENLSADRVTVLRPPLPSQDAAPESDAGTALPVDVEVKQLSIDDLHVSKAVAGIDSNWKVTGSLRLPADLAQGKVTLDAKLITGSKARLAGGHSLVALDPR
jgi:autotransporter translocation and assembly factor TamB